MFTIPTPTTAGIIEAIAEVLDHPAPRGRMRIDGGRGRIRVSELADVVDAPSVVSYRLFNRDISPTHHSAAVGRGETCSPVAAVGGREPDARVRGCAGR
jgi:hypothetical protein